jgi:protein-L-isoaspartate O-methyltransferase
MITVQVVSVMKDDEGKEKQVSHQTGLTGEIDKILVNIAMRALKEWLMTQMREKGTAYTPLRIEKIVATKEEERFCSNFPEIFSLL